MTILTVKHRQSKAVRSWLVPRKGASESIAAEVAGEGLKGFGIGEEEMITMKCDNETPILALRRRVAAARRGGVLEQEPATYEHESNGIIENGVKLGKGLLRVLLLAFEAKIGGRVPSDHPLMAWLVSHSSDVLSKHIVGKDGKTPYERLWGKPTREEGLEFGESLLYRLPRTEATNVLLESRWKPGVWLGRRWGSNVHQVYDFNDEKVHEVRAIQRRPLEERWSREAVERVNVYPHLLQPAGGKEPLEEASIIPDGDDGPEEPPEAVHRQPARVFISTADLETFGYSENCPKCARVRAGHAGRGFKHHEACRLRIEARLRELGDPRVAKADARIQRAIVDLGDPSAGPALREEEREGERRGEGKGEDQGGDKSRKNDKEKERSGGRSEVGKAGKVGAQPREEGVDEGRWLERSERVPLKVPRRPGQSRGEELPRRDGGAAAASSDEARRATAALPNEEGEGREGERDERGA